MRKIIAIVPLLLLVLLSACKPALDDDSFAHYWLRAWEAQEGGWDLGPEDYGWTEEQLEEYLEGLAVDEARSEKVVSTVAREDQEAADMLRLVLAMINLGMALEEWMDDIDWELELDLEETLGDIDWELDIDLEALLGGLDLEMEEFLRALEEYLGELESAEHASSIH